MFLIFPFLAMRPYGGILQRPQNDQFFFNILSEPEMKLLFRKKAAFYIQHNFFCFCQVKGYNEHLKKLWSNFLLLIIK